ncbi:MAG: SMP-30/gluconolactonase/LRE family protein [Deltaproteobacteria bacterium]|nr:SMP-30/gluconolactonase/LRE family protein [Deltaproteobacteria bacterium]
MRRSLLPLVVLLIACSSSSDPAAPSEAGVDAAVDAPPPQVGDVESFAEIEATSEGIAFGTRDGAPVLYVGAGDKILRVRPDGTFEKWVDVPGVLGIAARADGEMIACGKGEGDVGKSDMPGVLWRIDKAGNKSVLVGPSATTSFKLTNFVAIAPDDSLVFSDSAGNKLYRANADGTGVALVTDAIVYPNGLAFSRDGKTLYVASWSGKKVWSLARKADGGYEAPAVAIDGVENVDGLAVGASGDLYLVCSGLGVLRAREGKTTVVAPGSKFKLPANGAFGVGAFGDWLYVSNLIGFEVKRVWVGEAGAPLPAR